MGDREPKIRKRTTTREPNKGEVEWTSENLLLGTREGLVYGGITWRELRGLSWKELADR